jgi:DNA polymerase epsilon subunit 2
LFGPNQEVVLFRDDMGGRLQRNAIRFKPPAAELSGGNGDDERGQEFEVEMEAEQPTHHNMEDDEARSPRDSGPGNNDMDIDAAVSAAESQGAAPAEGVSDEIRTARKLVKTVLDQGYLSPFPLSTRPVLWDFAGSLGLYPLPSAVSGLALMIMLFLFSSFL